MDYKLALAVIATAQLCSALTPCTCTRQLDPVCGSDGVTYSNTCLLQCAQVSSLRPIYIVSQGPCETPPDIGNCGCSLDYIPVCGSDGKSYRNTCHVSCESIKNPTLRVAYEGECKRNFCYCTANYQPVCGTDGVTYSNDCELNCATALDSTLGIAYYSAC